MAFPQTRLRRLRELAPLREATREVSLSVTDFVYPLFVTHGRNIQRAYRTHAGRLSPVVG